MEPLVHVGNLSRRASLIAAIGAVGVATAAAVATPDERAGARAATRGGMYLLGDSWAAGLHADPEHALGQVAAEAMRMVPQVDAVSGTGYVNTAGHQNYLQRARTAVGNAHLVVVQGGSNDDRQALDAIHAAAIDTYRTLRGRFPGARMLVLGPGPDPQPVDAQQTAVDVTLQGAAESLGLTYISMLQRDWVPEHDTGRVIDPDNHHPTASGQAYLGLRLAAATRLLVPELFAAGPSSST